MIQNNIKTKLVVKMVEDRMKKYESKFSYAPKLLGGILLFGSASLGLASTFMGTPKADSLGMLDSGLLAILTGYGMDAVNYTKGYYNEMLEALYKEK